MSGATSGDFRLGAGRFTRDKTGLLVSNVLWHCTFINFCTSIQGLQAFCSCTKAVKPIRAKYQLNTDSNPIGLHQTWVSAETHSGTGVILFGVRN